MRVRWGCGPDGRPRNDKIVQSIDMVDWDAQINNWIRIRGKKSAVLDWMLVHTEIYMKYFLNRGDAAGDVHQRAIGMRLRNGQAIGAEKSNDGVVVLL